MIHNIVREEIRVPGTLPDTYLETFLLDITPKFLIQERDSGAPAYCGLPRGRLSVYIRQRGGNRRDAV